MGVSEILGILNLVGLLAVAVLLILHLRRRTDGQATAVTPEDLLRSEEKRPGLPEGERSRRAGTAPGDRR